jgi:hypothetical protein
MYGNLKRHRLARNGRRILEPGNAVFLVVLADTKNGGNIKKNDIPNNRSDAKMQKIAIFMRFLQAFELLFEKRQ